MDCNLTSTAQDPTRDFLAEIRSFLNPDEIQTCAESRCSAGINTLAMSKVVAGVLTPSSIQHLQKIVKAGSHYGVALYPLSRGKNIGYGERTPYQDNQWVLSLERLNAIRGYDPQAGEVFVEAGVSQAQLAEFLLTQGGLFWADVTGASPDASIVGNTLEAGFGHTPIGDHRKHILEMEVVLPDGTLFQTGKTPSLGPDLAQLFVQSNFGVVTGIRIPLLPVPQRCLTYTLSFTTDEAYLAALPVLSHLRLTGVINSLLHSGNATRTLMTSASAPAADEESGPLSETRCLELFNKGNPLKAGAWTAVGALYGFKNEVREKAAILEAAIRPFAKVRFFTDRKLTLIDRALRSRVLRGVKCLERTRQSVTALKALHGIIRGKPSTVPSENILWRTTDPARLGLAWFAPVVPATALDIKRLLEAVRPIFAKFGFEMPLTLTLVSPKTITAVFNICFDRECPESVHRAHKAYHALSQTVAELGYHPYRMGILSQPSMPETKLKFLNTIKDALDPKHILAPGRYGIVGHRKNGGRS